MRALVLVNRKAVKKLGDAHPAIVTDTAAHLRDELARRTTDPPTRLVVAGGDGTHMAALSAALDVFGPADLPELAFVAAGTVNTTARALGASGTPAAQVRRALASTTVRKAACLRVETDVVRHGFIWGTGLVSSFFDHYDAAGGGALTAARLAAKVAGSALVGGRFGKSVLRRVPFSIAVDGDPPREDEWSLAVTSVLRDVGIGIRVTYRAGEAEDRIHFVASTADPGTLARAFHRTFLARPLGAAATVDALAREVRLRFPGGGRFILDGDGFSADEVILGAGPSFPCVALE